MRVLATHDASGHIVGIAIAAEDVKDGEFVPISESGLSVSEIDLPDGRKRLSEAVNIDVMQNFRVEQSAAPARLVKKTPPAS